LKADERKVSRDLPARRRPFSAAQGEPDWKIDHVRGFLTRQLDYGILFLVPIDELRTDAGLCLWMKTIARQPWADSAAIGGFFQAAMKSLKGIGEKQ